MPWCEWASELAEGPGYPRGINIFWLEYYFFKIIVLGGVPVGVRF